MKKIFLMLLLGLGFVGLSMLTNPQSAKAAWGVGNNVGYFTGNVNDGSGDFVLPGGTDTNPSIPYSVTTVSEFEDFITNKLDSSSGWEHTGAAFIVQTMRSNDACSGWCTTKGIDSSSDAVKDWKDRIDFLLKSGGWICFSDFNAANKDPSKCTATYNDKDNCVNTMDIHDHVGADSDPEDVASYSDCTNERAIQFYNKNGTAVYVVKYRCANPIGGLPGLPENKLPVGQFKTVQCSDALKPGDDGVIVTAHDPDDQPVTSGNGNAVQVEVRHGGDIILGPTAANDSVTGYSGEDYHQFNGSDWTDFVNDNIGDSSVVIHLWAKDKEDDTAGPNNDGWVQVDDATFDATKCANHNPHGTLTLKCSADFLTASAIVTYWDTDSSSTYPVKANIGPPYTTASKAGSTSSANPASYTWAGIPVPAATKKVTVTLRVPDVGPAPNSANNFTLTKTIPCSPPTADCAGQNMKPTVTLPDASSPAPTGPNISSGSTAPGDTTNPNWTYYQEVPGDQKITSAHDQYTAPEETTSVTWSPGYPGTYEPKGTTYTMDYQNYKNDYPYDDHNTSIYYVQKYSQTVWTTDNSPDYYKCDSGDGNPDATTHKCTHTYTGTAASCGGGSSGSNVAIYNSSGQYVWDQCLIDNGAPKSDGTCATGSKYNGECYTFVSWAGVNCPSGGSPSGGSSCSYQYDATKWYVFTKGSTSTPISDNGGNPAGAPQLLECYPRNFEVQDAPDTDISQVSFNNNENPSQVTIGTKIAVKFYWDSAKYGGKGIHDDMKVNNLSYTGTYYVERANGGVTLLGNDIQSNNVFVGSTKTNNAVVTKSPSYSRTYDVSTLGLSPGDEVCAEFTIDPASGGMNHTGAIDGSTVAGSVDSTRIPYRPTCSAPVSAMPYTRFYGNDVIAGIMFSGGATCTSSSIAASRNGDIGSGSQFAAQSLGAIQGFASAFLRNAASPPSSPTGLSFANTNPPGGDGGVFGGNCPQLPNYFADDLLPPSSAARADQPIGSVGISATAPLYGSHAYYSSTGGTFNGGTIGNHVASPDGSSIAIFVKGNVYIKNNISFDTTGWTWDGTNRTTNVPSFYLVVQGDIDIDPGVSQLDGVYIAQSDSSGNGGTIRTCSSPPSGGAFPANTLFDSCKSQLTVRGAFVAQNVLLDRSYQTLHNGVSGESPFGGTQNAAEIFDFSPEVYLNNPAMNAASGPDKNKYDYITSLSPVL